VYPLQRSGSGCCLTNHDNNDHYAREGIFCSGSLARNVVLATPAVEVKRKPNAFGGNMAYMCEMGQKAFVVGPAFKHMG
jgi:hypothetical protein